MAPHGALPTSVTPGAENARMTGVDETPGIASDTDNTSAGGIEQESRVGVDFACVERCGRLGEGATNIMGKIPRRWAGASPVDLSIGEFSAPAEIRCALSPTDGYCGVAYFPSQPLFGGTRSRPLSIG